jgi:hypothetical protein
MILGLVNSEHLNRFKNYRRSVLYWYPNGAAPLTGLTSLLKEEDTDDPEFKWFEERLREQRTQIANIATTIAYAIYAVTANAATGGAIGGAWVATTASADIATAIPTSATDKRFGMEVADTSEFRVGHVIKWTATLTTSALAEVQAVVEYVDHDNSMLGFRFIAAYGTIDHDAAGHEGRDVVVIGSSYHEGSLNVSTGIYQTPVELSNYTQIFRTPFELTGTARKTSVKYDETGPQQDLAKQHMVHHYIEMEKAFHFGDRALLALTGRKPARNTGGVLFFLKQWELGTVYGNSSTAITADTDDQKRIIENTSGTMSIKRYEDLLERAFRVTNNKANEKLVFCGNKFLLNINRMYAGQTTFNSDLPSTATFGMDVSAHRTPFGTSYYKTHPLYNQSPVLRYCALILDVNELYYRYVQGRDTTLLPNREPNDADWRTDEWLSECGLEPRFPEAHMFIKNVQEVE